jgi:hypothetical protein
MIARDLEQGAEAAEDHALVIGPRGTAIVLARRGEPVVDQAVGADQAV